MMTVLDMMMMAIRMTSTMMMMMRRRRVLMVKVVLSIGESSGNVSYNDWEDDQL